MKKASLGLARLFHGRKMSRRLDKKGSYADMVAHLYSNVILIFL